jgi:hypothetical protein
MSEKGEAHQRQHQRDPRQKKFYTSRLHAAELWLAPALFILIGHV